MLHVFHVISTSMNLSTYLFIFERKKKYFLSQEKLLIISDKIVTYISAERFGSGKIIKKSRGVFKGGRLGARPPPGCSNFCKKGREREEKTCKFGIRSPPELIPEYASEEKLQQIILFLTSF